MKKKEKIYLAKKNKIEAIAKSIQNAHEGSMYILEVAVEEQNLFPDEDTFTDNWVDSLRVNGESSHSNYGGSCSHKGGIKDFVVYKKLPYKLSKKRLDHYFIRDIEGEDFESLEKEMKIEIVKNKKKEKAALEKYNKIFKQFNVS